MNLDLSHHDINAVLSALQAQAAAIQNTMTTIQAQLQPAPQAPADAGLQAPALGHTVGPDGWVPHDGGPCPVSGDTRVDVKFRNGGTPAGFEAGEWAWSHHDSEDDIVAWRPAAPTVPEQLQSAE